MSLLKNPKTIVLTVPLRSAPSNYVPIGSLAVVTFLRRAGFLDTYLYDIDWFRPDFNEVIEYLKKEKADRKIDFHSVIPQNSTQWALRDQGRPPFLSGYNRKGDIF